MFFIHYGVYDPEAAFKLQKAVVYVLGDVSSTPFYTSGSTVNLMM